jgi:hypothetical protein
MSIRDKLKHTFEFESFLTDNECPSMYVCMYFTIKPGSERILPAFILYKIGITMNCVLKPKFSEYFNHKYAQTTPVASASRTEVPGFESRRCVRFLGVYTWQCCCQRIYIRCHASIFYAPEPQNIASIQIFFCIQYEKTKMRIISRLGDNESNVSRSFPAKFQPQKWALTFYQVL